MRKGDVLNLSDISLNPEEISHIYFGKNQHGEEGFEIIFIEPPHSPYKILPQEFAPIKEFAEVNNLLRGGEIRFL